MKDKLIHYFTENNFKNIKDTGRKWDEIGAEFGMSGEAARKTMAKIWNTANDTSSLKLKSQWQVLGKGGEIITLQSFTASTTSSDETQEEKLEAIYDRLFQKYTGFKIPASNYSNYSFQKLALLNLYDAHIDKIPLKDTTGSESTVKENIDRFLAAVDECLEVVKMFNVEKIILPIGNDLFHTNGFDRLTKKGTVLEYFGSPEENYYTICDAVIEAILRASTVARVEVLMVKGNHDEDKITGLGYWLQRTFSKHPDIDVDMSRLQRKYIEYGKNLLMFAHGDKEKGMISKVPLIMATEQPVLWGRTKYRKCYFGDLHHGFEYQFLKSKDQPGVEVEYLRSVGTDDTWHKDFGWIGIPKTAYVQIIDKEEGEYARFKINV